jgi:hypothetical protein
MVGSDLKKCLRKNVLKKKNLKNYFPKKFPTCKKKVFVALNFFQCTFFGNNSSDPKSA